MILLTLSGVGKAFVMHRVLDDVNLTVQQGSRMGLVGTNGSGKSTLFQIIAGLMQPDEGSVSMLKGTRVGLLTQQADIESDLTVTEELSRVFDPLKAMEKRLRALEEEIASSHADPQRFADLSAEYDRLLNRFDREGGYEWPSRIQGVLAGLGFTKERALQPSNSLSGGEKTRLCLARILLTQPELLLLDEPTNHLDLQSIQWLEDTLKKYRGTVIVISHDRYFLNSVCDCMAELSMTHLSQYAGNYETFVAQREANLERQMKEYEMQQAEITRQLAIIARYKAFNREKSIKAARSHEMKLIRMLAPDSGREHKHASSRERLLENISAMAKPVVSEDKVNFSFEARRRTGEDVLMVQGLAKSFGERQLFENFDLHIRAGDRVAIIGPNGIGKTTLISIIARKLLQDKGEIVYGSNLDLGYYDQQQADLTGEKDVMHELWDAFPRMEPGDVRSVLALFLFTGDDVFKPVSKLSGGEKGRLALAKLMLRKDNFLILDEPTNHLDMDSREVLEDALSDFSGTILTVSHDRYFLNRIADRIVEMRADGTTEYIGNYDDYLEKKRRLEFEAEQEDTLGMTKTQIDKEKRKERAKKENRKALEQRNKALEKEIAQTEAKAAEIEALMGDPDLWLDPAKGQQTAREHEETLARIEQLYEEWQQVQEALEE
ncbi:MAG: ABC-F family ATP-binding cassette domain-containing protein [Eubacteriales bacterium]|nr:ABC-F family ATP-binding cassette domain-containing protein [Eubacteriales bacterium]